MPDKPPADRTVTAPSDAAPRTADAHSSGCADEAHRRAAAQTGLVPAAALSGLRAARRDPQRASREEPARHRGTAAREAGRAAAGRSRSGDPRSAHDRRDQQRSPVSAHGRGRLPLRAQRAAAAHRARHRQPARAESADGQPRADDPRTVPAGHDPQPARRRVDSVHGPRLVRPQALEDRVHRRADRARRRLRRAPRAPLGARTCAGRFDAPAGLRQPQQPLVGCVADLWLRSRDGRQAAHPVQRQAAHRADRTAAGRSRHGGALLGLHRQLVDRPGDAAYALHPRAQLHLRPARAPEPALDRRTALPQGEADQLGVDGEDPHHRMDSRDRAEPDHRDGDERQLVRARRRGSPGRARLPRRQGAARRHRRLERRPSHRPVFADGGVRLRLPDAPADSGRLRLPLGGHRPACSRSGSCTSSQGARHRRSPSA